MNIWGSTVWCGIWGEDPPSELEKLLESVRGHFSTHLPDVLSCKGVDDFDAYIAEPPYAVDEKQLAVYMGAGVDAVSNEGETLRMQAQLPKIMNHVKYHDAIWKVLKDFDAETMGFDSKTLAYEGYYPGEANDGGASSFLLYEISFTKENDDCDLDD